MAWTTESYQFVAFHPPQDVSDAFQIWLNIFGASPDNYQRHPDPNTKASQSMGSFAGYNWQLQCAPGRVDLTLLGQSTTAPFPEVGNSQAAVAVLKERVLKLLADHVRTVRLAVVSQGFQNFDTLQQANVAFNQHAWINADPSVSSDLMFGLNVRKEVGDPPVTMNRLCRWQALVKQLMQFQITGTAQEQLPAIMQPAIVLNVDINTLPQQIPYKPAEAARIAMQLFDECDAIREGGYGRLMG